MDVHRIAVRSREDIEEETQVSHQKHAERKTVRIRDQTDDQRQARLVAAAQRTAFRRKKETNVMFYFKLLPAVMLI